MARYFMEVTYKGTQYSGFQIQENAATVQSEIEKVFTTLHRKSISLTGSSRTDAGVHALQNYFHFDVEEPVHPQAVYKLNAILPTDIAVRRIIPMHPESHSRFDARSREYSYHIHQFKNPFLTNTSLYYPYKLDVDLLNQAAAFIALQTGFFSFSKANTQVNNFSCNVVQSHWKIDREKLTYTIEANRFLRGMVRLLTATLLQVGRGKISLSELGRFFQTKTRCGLSVPPHGLYLNRVKYPTGYLPA